MKKATLVLVVILILLSGVTVGCNGQEGPPSTEDMVNYVRNVWRVEASADEVRQVLSLEDPITGDDFFSEIGGILTVISMKKDMDTGEYAKAAEKGVGWLFRLYLKETGFSWLSPYVGVALAAPDIAEWIVEKIDENSFNAQVAFYLCYRENGVSHEEIRRDYMIPWINPPWNCEDCGIPPLVCAYRLSPVFTAKYTPEDVLRVGNAFWEAKQAEKYRSADEGRMKTSFVTTLEQLRSPTAALSPWPMVGHDAQNTFCSPYQGPESPSIKWVTDFDELEISSFPLVGTDGTIYLSGQRNDTTAIIAVDRQGGWRMLSEISGLAALGAIGPSGTLYVSLSEDGRGSLLAVNPHGKELWRADVPGVSGYPIVSSDAIYVGYHVLGPGGDDVVAGGLLAFNPDGTRRWSIPGIFASFSPAIAPDGTVYACTHEGKVCAYNSRGGKLWEYDGRPEWPEYYEETFYYLSVGPDGTVYVLPHMEFAIERWEREQEELTGGRLLALTPRGTKKWHVDFPRPCYRWLSPPAIAPDGSLHVVLEGKALFKVSPNGGQRQFALGDFTTVPIIDVNGTVYTGIGMYVVPSQVVAFYRDGTAKWRLDISPPGANLLAAIGADGIIYACTGKELFAIGR